MRERKGSARWFVFFLFFPPSPCGCSSPAGYFEKSTLWVFFLKKQHVAANSASETWWELLSAGVVAAAGKGQAICSAAGTQPVSWVWWEWVPAQPSGTVLLPWCIPTLARRRLGDARPASLLRIVTQIAQERPSSQHGMLSKESEPGAL